MSNTEHEFTDTNRHLVEVPDTFAIARWPRDADVATIARWILGTLKYEPHAGDTAALRARVGPKGHVEIRGGWIEREAVAVLRKLVPGLVHPLPIVMTRGDEPGPSLSGPLRKGGSYAGSIIFDGRSATRIIGTSSRQIAA
jgi:hypothetical protein